MWCSVMPLQPFRKCPPFSLTGPLSICCVSTAIHCAQHVRHIRCRSAIFDFLTITNWPISTCYVLQTTPQLATLSSVISTIPIICTRFTMHIHYHRSTCRSMKTCWATLCVKCSTRPVLGIIGAQNSCPTYTIKRAKSPAIAVLNSTLDTTATCQNTLRCWLHSDSAQIHATVYQVL